MTRSVESIVAPDILEWARTTSGMSIDEAAAKIPTKPENLAAWENGKANPSMSQLRKMVVIYKRPISDFYLPKAPDEKPLPHDFRRLPGEIAFRYSRELRYQLRAATERRQLALDLAKELDQQIRPFVAKVVYPSDPEVAGKYIRDLLAISFNLQSTWKDPRVGYNSWRAAIERIGVLVFQVTGISTREMLGFSLVENLLPVIAVNRKLLPNGRTFTLVHELAHLLIGKSSICDIEEGEQRPPQEQAVEVFCNAVAAATLVPRDQLINDPLIVGRPKASLDWSNDEIAVLAKRFCVSQEVIFRRLVTFGLASAKDYANRRRIWGTIFDDVAPVDPEAEIRRNMPQEVISNFGKPFTQLVYSSYENSYTSLSDVSKFLGLRPEKVSKLQDLLARGH